MRRDTIPDLMFKLGQSAAKRWCRLRGYHWLEKLMQGITLIDGIEKSAQTNVHRSGA